MTTPTDTRTPAERNAAALACRYGDATPRDRNAAAGCERPEAAVVAQTRLLGQPDDERARCLDMLRRAGQVAS